MNINQHLCDSWECIICRPHRKSDPVVDNTVDNFPPEEGWAVDNSPPVVDKYLWTGKWEESLYPEHQVNGPLYYALFLEAKLREAQLLVLWFSRKWGNDHDPMFPWRDDMSGQELPENRALCDTWYEIVRHGVVCEACEGSRGVRQHTNQDRVFTFDPCVACGGRGFTTSEDH